MGFLNKIYLFFGDLCYTIDFFKTPFTFHFSRKRRLISNKFGTILSISIIFYLSYSIFYSDMIQKTNPSVLIQKKFGDIRPEIILNKTNFELAVGLFDENATNYQIDSSEFKVTASQIKIVNNETNNQIIRSEIIQSIDIQNCTLNDFHISNSKNLLNQNVLCFRNFEVETKGYVNEKEYSSFKIDLNICDNKTSNITCKSKEEIIEKIKGKFFGMHYIDYNVNFNNFSHPIIPTTQAEFIMLDGKSRKNINIYLTSFEFLDENSVFGLSPHKYQAFYRNVIINDFANIDNSNITQTPISTFWFFSSPETQQNIRTYQKLNQLLSSIGGSASLFISIGFFFMSFLNEWTLRSSLFKHIYDLEEEEISQNEEEENNDKSAHAVINKLYTKDESKFFQDKSKFFKIEMKNLKPDSFVLDRYSIENEPNTAFYHDLKKKKRNRLSLWKHIIFKIKTFFGLNLNENNEIYKIIDKGYKNLMNGNFIFSKLQELECIQKMILSEKEFILMKSLDRPKLILKLNHISKNVLKKNHFGLYPIKSIDDQLKEYDSYNQEKLFKEWELENLQIQKEPKNIFRQKLFHILSINQKKH